MKGKIKTVLQMINEVMEVDYNKEEIRECLEECIAQIQERKYDEFEKFIECICNEEEYKKIITYIKVNIDSTI